MNSHYFKLTHTTTCCIASKEITKTKIAQSWWVIAQCIACHWRAASGCTQYKLHYNAHALPLIDD